MFIIPVFLGFKAGPSARSEDHALYFDRPTSAGQYIFRNRCSVQHSPLTTRLGFQRSLAETARSPKAVKPNADLLIKEKRLRKQCALSWKRYSERNFEMFPRSAMLRWNDSRYMFYTYFSALQPSIISCKCCRRCVYQRYILYTNTIFQYYTE